MTTPSRLSRLFLHLPVNTEDERRAARQVINELVSRYGGATISLLESPVFRGYWESDGEVFEDVIALFLIDVQNREIESPEFVAELTELRTFSFRAYEQAGAPQLEIWLVAHSIFRVGG
jgi:hypothetical protein